MKIQENIILKPGVAINCKTEEEAKALLLWADQIGKKCDEIFGSWNDMFEHDCLNDSKWSIYKENTCYNIYEGGFASTDYFTDILHYTVICFEDIVLN